jgi:hypothetical protein
VNCGVGDVIRDLRARGRAESGTLDLGIAAGVLGVATYPACNLLREKPTARWLRGGGAEFERASMSTENTEH